MKSDKGIRSFEQELQEFPPIVAGEFQKALPAVTRQLSEDDFYSWAREGLTIAQSGSDCWKAAAEYFKATPQILEILDSFQVINWAQRGSMLSRESADLSLDYFRESLIALRSLPVHQLEEWAELGKNLHKSTHRVNSPARQFFQISSRLFGYLTLDEIVQFISFADDLFKGWHEFAGDCLNSAEEVFSQLESQDRKLFLALAAVFADTNQSDLRSYFNVGPKVLSRIEGSERARFLSLAERISRRAPHTTLPFLIDCSQALDELPLPMHHHLLTLAEELIPMSCLATTEFLKSCPTVISRIKLSGLEIWFREGIRTVQMSEESGIAYFRMGLNRSAELLEQLSEGIELSRVQELLGMYCAALTAKNIPIVSVSSPDDKKIGWVSPEKPWAGGVIIFLPKLIEKYSTKKENFAWCKVVTTHQAGHIEFGSFGLRFEKKAIFFADLRPQLAQQLNMPGALTDMQRFFDLFDDRKVASDIFMVVEDSRVDYLINYRYKGISGDYRKIQNEALRARPPLDSLPLKELFLEVLTQLSLERQGEFSVPTALQSQLLQASFILRQAQSPQATVEDSAEATIRLYQILSQIPNKFARPDEWGKIDLTQNRNELRSSVSNITLNSISSTDKEADGLPYTSPQMVEFRGIFKPELVQLLNKLKEENQKKTEGEPLSLPLQTLKELVGENGEIEISELFTGDGAAKLFVSDLNMPGQQKRPLESGLQKEKDNDDSRGEASKKDDLPSFYYDEWDFKANDYRLKWCRVRQQTITEGTPDFFEATLNEHAALVAEIRRQFEQLNAPHFRKIKGLDDGEEFDLDAVVNLIVDRKAGQSPDEKVYWRKNKTERDVSVVFLLDMSSSTIEYIDEKQHGANVMYLVKDYKGYMEWLQGQQQNQKRPKAFKRIVDLEKESAVLLIKALETIGDTYAIYGFSGYSRDNVEFYVIKDLNEEFSEKIKRRIDSIAPLHSTRMGPAIRHATWKLEQQPATNRFLFLISDGRPQDHGYGADEMEKEYAINDTKMALVEARRKNITPFCLTIDRIGHDYLKTMCHDMGYEVLDDIESLPEHLPALYRRLTI